MLFRSLEIACNFFALVSSGFPVVVGASVVGAWQPDTWYSSPADAQGVYVTIPAYPPAHATPLGAKPLIVWVPATFVKSYPVVDGWTHDDAEQPETEYSFPSDAQALEATVPEYPSAHATLVTAKLALVLIPAALLKS